MAEIQHTSSGGIGFAGLLTILFIGLKLGGVITWSWVWVLAPLWIGFAFLLAIMGVGMLIGSIAWLIARMVR